MNDIIDAEIVEIQIDSTGKTWINVDGRCALRIGHAKLIVIDDIVDGNRCIFEEKN